MGHRFEGSGAPLRPRAQKCPTSRRNRAPLRSKLRPTSRRNQCPISSGIRSHIEMLRNLEGESKGCVANSLVTHSVVGVLFEVWSAELHAWCIRVPPRYSIGQRSSASDEVLVTHRA